MRLLSTLAILAALLLGSPAFAQQSADLPAPPPGQVVDRLLLDLETPSGTAWLYAVLSTEGDQSYLDVYKGLPFKRIHRWAIDLEGDKVKVGPQAVLMESHDGQRVTFYWREFVGYREGAVSMALIYHRATGRFETVWSD